MFKVGDKIKCIKLPLGHQWQLREGQNAIGKIYRIMDVRNGGQILKLSNEIGCFVVENFELVKLDLNEIDFLNAIQQNFKEGT